MDSKDTETVRINSRLGSNENAWLNSESKRTGVSKSALIQMAVEAYIIDSYEKRDIMQRALKHLNKQS
jgi:predicted DNA-binding protein